MLLNSRMDGESITKGDLISTIKKINVDAKEHNTIKAILKNFILPDSEQMAIKQKHSLSEKCIYTVPFQAPISPPKERFSSINEARKAFLNPDGNKNISTQNKTEPVLHYAQLAITTESDERSTGGGKNVREIVNQHKNRIIQTSNMENTKKKIIEQQQRKVSFKIKNASNSYRRPPLVTTMTISSSKVSELTKKFNDLVSNDSNVSKKQSKLAKSIDLQSVSRCASSSSTPSSTLSSSPNIKIVLRQKRGSRRRNNKKRCLSVDSIDNLVLSESSKGKIRVIRSKSDGTKIPKSPRRISKSRDSSGQQSGSDSIDGTPTKQTKTLTTKTSAVKTLPENSLVTVNNVKDVIKKFESEIKEQLISSTQKPTTQTPNRIPVKEKPKVPEKKSSLVVTKNIVLKDGIPKIKTMKPIFEAKISRQDPVNVVSDPDINKRKEPLYDKKKFKTNYIHSEKLPLHVVEIIQEEMNESVTLSISTETEALTPTSKENIDHDTSCEDLNTQITPNDSFLWRRKSTQIYSDSEKSTSESPYGFVTVTMNASSIVCNDEKPIYMEVNKSQEIPIQESQNTDENISSNNSDFETNLIEAYNKDVLVGFTSKINTKEDLEDGYELLEPPGPENSVTIIKIERPPKLNCPLPEIPKETSPLKGNKNNVYQCLLEMRSHPEGDESSLHNYEECGQLEERTRGDGDSDDGYEYCKSPIKPYCHASDSGIKIAENYNPYACANGKQNYKISKSVSGASTVSYEKIGQDRIYEKIPPRPESKDNSPSNKRHSYVSSDYTSYNDGENIYDTIKHNDGTLSHCYESIPNSPSMAKLRNNVKKLNTAQKRLSFDNVSNLSQSTLSSEQKTNSLYGQRSVISYNGQEIAFQVPSSETSVSDRSDRSDDWVDVSDEEKTEEKKIIIVRERSRGRRSPVSWSQKVRHQWQNSPSRSADKDCDSSDSGHLYESLEPPLPPPPAPIPYNDDFDSFDSDTDTDDHTKNDEPLPPTLPASRLPNPPHGGQYTLTKIASAAHRKMREIKRNFTKRYSVALDGRPFAKVLNNQNGTYDTPKNHKVKSPIYANCEKPENPPYSNIVFNDSKPAMTKDENPVKYERRADKRHSSGDVPPPLPEKLLEKPSTPPSEGKANGTLSRKAYFSFKSRFRRATSMGVDINDVPAALKITNSTFYLTDSMDGDSGFSNCDNAPAAGEKRNGTSRRAWADSAPCLALERPTAPPPPPPLPPPPHDLSAVNEELKRLLPTLTRKDKARTRTSWYAECGADTPPQPALSATASWYAEAGSYQAGNISSSSGASSGSHPASPLPHSLFTHEPLYQFYNAAKVESVCRDIGDSDSDAYSSGTPAPAGPAPRPSAMALVAPRGPARTLWCEVPEVLNSAVLSSLAPAQKRLQEAKFELLTSEASYLNSLSVLETHFASHPAFRDPHVLPPADWDILFSTILPVRKCSQILMADLEKCWQENILLHGICDIVRSHAAARFRVYVKYCEHQALMIRALARLRQRPAFAAALKRLESHPACQSLSLHSFLLLPMQRVTRLPLLLDAVLRNLQPEDHEYDGCMRALATLNDLVSQCNEGARNTERIEELWRLSQIIEMPSTLRNPPNLGPACSRRDRKPIRWLVRSGEMTQLVWKTDELKLTFGKKFHKTPLHLFLFNDHLVITKKKGEDVYVCVDHCPRSLVEVCSSDAVPAKHALLLTLLENHQGRTVEMLMSCESETAAARWGEALAAPAAGAGEAVYAGWDCPQVAALYAYSPAQPDELGLHEGDVVNVTRKTSEGWYYGERTRDGESGWFPGAYTAEIASPHVRARNLRQRYRLLALSGTYLGQKKK
ncbi:uncharacterized protein LOC121731895 isoform X2 [Aricia agestis]|uniref:uncharacterized protein LOC121731895 isoform X2 n=1 Tax=Aricia agestis TaxID=91739 RepID=UPI001C20A45F|nr:uncharacterized protein LOC121731895 isoform X2 [Aricia agestis]